MDAYTLPKKLNQIDNIALGSNDTTFRMLMDDLLNTVKMEIQAANLPKVSVNIAKAARKFSEQCYKKYHGDRDGIAGANMYHDNDDIDMEIKRQFICDGYVGVSYSMPFDAVVRAVGTPLDANSILDHKGKETHEIALPSLAELKKILKTEIAERGRKWSRSLIRMQDGKLFNIEYIIRIMELCGLTGGEIALDSNSPFSPMYINTETEDGNKIKAVVLPVRPSGNDEDKILVDYKEGN